MPDYQKMFEELEGNLEARLNEYQAIRDQQRERRINTNHIAYLMDELIHIRKIINKLKEKYHGSNNDKA